MAIFALAGAPLVMFHRTAILSYYLEGHEGHDKYLRAAAVGNSSLLKALTFYPRSLAADHLGIIFPALSAAAVAVALVWRLPTPVVEQQTPARPARAGAFVPVWLCLLVPLVILTIDVDKTHVVGNILVPPLVWAIVLIVLWLLRPERLACAHSRPVQIVAGVALLLGLGIHVAKYTRHERPTARRAQVAALLAMYDEIADECRKRGWNEPRIATDCTADYLRAQVLTVLTYERHGRLLAPVETLTRLDRYPTQEVWPRLAQSDFVILTERTDRRRELRYPFNIQMEQLHGQLLVRCRQSMNDVVHLRALGRDLTVFVRRDDGAEAGGLGFRDSGRAAP